MSQQDDKAFDVSKVEEKLKNVKTLSDLTGRGGVIQEMIKSTRATFFSVLPQN